MTVRARKRLAILWIAIIAILVVALAPSLVRALSAQGNQALPWHETCTTAGLIVRVADDSAPAPAPTNSGAHCPWCKLYAQPALLPLGNELVRFALATVTAPRIAGDPLRRPSQTRRFAAPRGPPFIAWVELPVSSRR